MVTPKKKKPKKGGRKPIKIDYKKLFKLASLGLSDKQICGCLKISQETFIKKRNSIPEFSEVLEAGRAEGIRFHAEQIMKQSRKGGYQATALFLKSHGGPKWQDRTKTDIRATLQGNPDKP